MSCERLTPFMLFFCEHKDAAQAAHPNAAPHEVSQIIADQWKSLSAEKSRAYSVLSATYTDQKKGFANPKKRKERKERDPKAPKSATSAYMYFSKHHRMLLKQENSDLTFGDLGKTVGAMWKAATPEEKRPFEELATEDKSRYINELNDYRSLQAEQPATTAKQDAADSKNTADDETPPPPTDSAAAPPPDANDESTHESLLPSDAAGDQPTPQAPADDAPAEPATAPEQEEKIGDASS